MLTPITALASLLFFSTGAGASTLTTTTAGGNGAGGAMFDVSASTDLTISALRSYSFSTVSGGCAYEIYTTTSTLSSVLQTPSAWSLIASGTTAALTAGGSWDVTLTSPIAMTSGSRRAFYVVFPSCTVQYTNGTSVGAVYASNADMSIYEGYGRSYSATFTGSTFSPRVWNGTITYETCANPTTWYRDADSDGYGVSTTSQSSCSQPTGYVATATDCDDASATDNPGATEIVGNGDDENCDGAETCYLDSDNDGYRPDTTSTLASTDADCNDSREAVSTDPTTDCDDADVGDNPSASEITGNGDDENCDGAETCYDDDDDDGWLDTSGDTRASADTDCADANEGTNLDNTRDCDDNNAAANPAQTEICDSANVDEDCDSLADDNDTSATGQTAWYADSDSDGYGNRPVSTLLCDVPSGYVADSTDCDDGSAAISPAAQEICDSASVDEDCDGSADDADASASGQSVWYRDGDSDGWGDAGAALSRCDQPAGYLSGSGDCDDADNSAYPGATEYCDGADDDCDGQIDEDGAADVRTWYVDSDGDSFGDAGVTLLTCYQPSGYVSDDADCDDTDSGVYPGAAEYCDGEDDDCDGQTDEASAVDAPTWYADSDADGYGDPATAQPACAQPSGTVSDSADCDDTDTAAYPGAPEIAYDAVDQDCDGADLCDVDSDGRLAVECGADDCDDSDGAVYPGAPDAWYDGTDSNCDGGDDYDADLDGYISASWGGDDCDDGSAATFPGAPDAPYDGVITDCDSADEYDADGDGYDSDAWGGADCDDASSDVSPAATEIWYDGFDQNCDSADDYDADADGHVSATYGGDDCDDNSAATFPGAPDAPYDGVINDCDGADEYDQDGDGALHPSGGGDDCDDANSAVFPGADEAVADGLDSDCDGGDRCYVDADDDGQREESGGTLLSDDVDCDDAGEGSADEPALDCNDNNATTYDGAPEICDDGADNDCDSEVDEGCDTGPGDSDTGPVDSEPVGDSDDSGPQDTGKDPEGCACSTGGGSAGFAGLMLLSAVALRRRREG